MATIRLALLACITATPLLAQQTRDLSAHEHGVSTLEIAVEGGRVEMNLLSPGADIVGFEYPASSAADKDAVEAAIRALLLPENVVALPEAAECRLAGAVVQLDSGDHDEPDDHAEGEEPAQEGAGHSEFHAGYRFDCDHPEGLDTIAFPFFDTFAHAQEIEARFVTETGAGSVEISRDAASLTLE